VSAQTRARYLGNAHLFDGVLIVEFESHANDQSLLHSGIAKGGVSIARYVQQATAVLQACSTLRQLYDTLANQVRILSGFDRVMVYRFMPDQHGVVDGESLREGLEPFHGLHYPASDIPAQARRLYTLNPMRLIVDINAASVPFEPVVCPLTGRPLDLTYSSFRSVSPIHIEYLQNMGVAASMSISIISNGQLWGLIACHHYQPRELSLELRAACEMLGTMAGGYITARQLSHNLQLESERQTHIANSLSQVNENDSFHLGIANASDEMLSAIDAEGLAIVLNDRVSLFGTTPPAEAVSQLCEEIINAHAAPIWHTRELSDVYPWMLEHVAVASGVLSIRLGGGSNDMILFFRPEFVSEIDWAGKPEKNVVELDSDVRLSPRKSFAKWKQTVHQQSREWSVIDQKLAKDLHAGLMRLIAGRATELGRINERLLQINADLDSFAYAASHDLKEPLRTISQTVFFMERALGGDRSEEVDRRLKTIQQTIVRMNDLLEGLLRVSRAGSGELNMDDVDLTEVVTEASQLSLHSQSEEVRLVIKDLPRVRADFMGLRDVFQNLMVNACKYNRNRQKEIEIGSTFIGPSESAPPEAHGRLAIYVRDNGIGIAEPQQKNVFQVFKRLHGPGEFGGGSGIGLAVVKRVIERHGGAVWIESQPEIGTTFYFTLETNSNEN
jgi:light-regulated signal transduction histidine kinase (bacteriophytochrome)